MQNCEGAVPEAVETAEAAEVEAAEAEEESKGYEPEYLKYHADPVLAHQRLSKVRAIAEKLNPGLCMLGWFGPRTGESLVPMNRVECHVLYRGDKERRYATIQKVLRSAMHASVPLIHRDSMSNMLGTIHVGGIGWRYFLHDGRMNYTRKADTPHAETVGTLRDVFCDVPDWSVSYTFDRKKVNDRLALLNCKLVWQVGEILQDKYLSSDIFRYPDTEIRMPKFYTAAGQDVRPILRKGKALDDLVLSCARSGNWPIKLPVHLNEYTCTSRGEVELHLDGTTAQFTSENDEFTDRFHLTKAEQQLEVLIEEVFKMSFGVKLFPAIAMKDKLRVKRFQPLFRPIPRREWSMEQLKALPEYEMLTYIAVLTTAIEQDKLILLDHAFAYSSKDPWVDFSELPFMVQKLENPTRHQVRIDHREHPLCLSTSNVVVNLLDISAAPYVKEFRNKIVEKPKVHHHHKFQSKPQIKPPVQS